MFKKYYDLAVVQRVGFRLGVGANACLCDFRLGVGANGLPLAETPCRSARFPCPLQSRARDGTEAGATKAPRGCRSRAAQHLEAPREMLCTQPRACDYTARLRSIPVL